MTNIRKQHTELLSRSFKHKITPKYRPEQDEQLQTTFRYIKRPVVPEKNHRLDMLAEPNRFRVIDKYEASEEPSTILSRAVLEATCTPRLDHLSRPYVRSLVATKNDKKFLGKSFVDTMNERIAMSLDTIYYHKVKSLMNINAERLRLSKSATVKRKVFSECGDSERLLTLASPKTYHPPLLPRRLRMKLEALQPRIEKLAIPLRIYKRPSQESVVKRLQISPDALEYVATERMMELSRNPPWKLVKPYVYTGAVKRSALEAKITDRVLELSAPRPRANAPEMDLKENAYEISPAALKYKPSHRIQQLAKPVMR